MKTNIQTPESVTEANDSLPASGSAVGCGDLLHGLLDQLDWPKILACTDALEWVYGYGESAKRVTIEDLKDCALSNLRHVKEEHSEECSCFSGGFLAIKNKDGTLEIYFVVDWSMTDEPCNAKVSDGSGQ